MKKIYFLKNYILYMRPYLYLLFIIFSIENSHSQNNMIGWKKQISGTNNTLFSINCIDNDTVVVVGANGTILRTINGGTQWDSVYSNTSNNLYAIKFTNLNIGYAIGTNGTILKTSNSGKNWTNIGINTSMTLLNMHFFNADTGCVVGGNGDVFLPIGTKGILLKTFNGGINWIIDSTYNKTLSSVFFFDRDTGYITANRCDYINPDSAFICKTTNGGNTWNVTQSTVSPNSYYSNIHFTTPKIGFVSGHTELYKTNDFGFTWNAISNQMSIRSYQVMDSCSLYLTWTDMPSGSVYLWDFCNNQASNIQTNDQLWGVHFIDKDYGFAIGWNYTGGIIYKRGIITAVGETDNSNLNISPNPFNGKVSIKFNKDFLKNTEYNISIFNSLGKQVIEISKSNFESANQFEIDLSKYKSGIYFLIIKQNQKNIYTKKLIKI